VFGMEADDALSIYQHKDLNNADENGGQYNTIICTLDKDLDMVPGWHYRWSKGNVDEIEPWFQTSIGGLRCFYKQCLLGDSVDNIHGLYGVGPQYTYINKIDEADSPEFMFDLVRELYRKWYGNYGDQFLLETGQLLWMKRTIDDMWELPY